MKQSHLGIKTDHNAPADADSKNAKLLTRAGFIKKEMAGVYSFLPMGFRALKKIEKIIFDEMERVGASPLLMPALTPIENWKKTGREKVDIAFRPTENTVLGWSHEEIITPIAKHLLRSPKDFPKCFFQIQTKFRDEPRAKSGLLRGREFLMKDAYSFHLNRENLREFYEKMAAAYFRIFEKCGLKSFQIESGGGEFSENISHEFSVISPAGEDKMIFCEKCGFAQNTEILGEISKCPKCAADLKIEKCIEVGNIFDLGTKYSDAFKFFAGGKNPVFMGCYGIGVSRLLGTIVETFADDAGMIFPKKVAPFSVHLISLRENAAAEKLSEKLENADIETLFDDRDESPGKKFADSDLFGIPLRVVISPKMREKNAVEIKIRKTGETREIPENELLDFCKNFFKK